MVSKPLLAQTDLADQMASLKWIRAPNTVQITDKANLKITGNQLYLDSIETNKFLKMNGNLPRNNSYTLLEGKEFWFAVFDFTGEGYVKDNEKINADELLKALKEGNVKSLEERKKQGLAPLYLDGWYIPPRYDTETKRLEWATKLRDENNNPLINFTTRILGRSGYMSVTLVSSPENLDRDIKSFKTALKNFDYVNGERYSEWRDGDKVAAYGLGALVVGGAAAAVASKGGFKFLWAILLAAFVGIGAFLKRIFTKKQ
jgi:uncharacterized membrane-anchored protein